MNISDRVNNFSSSEEKFCGWWETSPLYCKLFSGDTSTTVRKEIPITADYIRGITSFSRGNNGSVGGIYYSSSADNFRIWVDTKDSTSSYLNVTFGSSYPTKPVHWSAVIYYLKA